MALDSRAKRSSAILFDLAFGRPLPAPDGDLANQADRQHMAFKYAAALVLTVISLFPGLTTQMRLTGVGN